LFIPTESVFFDEKDLELHNIRQGTTGRTDRDLEVLQRAAGLHFNVAEHKLAGDGILRNVNRPDEIAGADHFADRNIGGFRSGVDDLKHIYSPDCSR
jgi:hypothetical protein